MSDLRKVGAKLAEAERKARARYVTARLEQGASLTAIACELGIGGETLRLWWQSYTKGPVNAAPRASVEREWRDCKACSRKFVSEKADGAWLRYCDSCRRNIANGVVCHAIAHDGRKGRAR